MAYDSPLLATAGKLTTTEIPIEVRGLAESLSLIHGDVTFEKDNSGHPTQITASKHPHPTDADLRLVYHAYNEESLA